MKLAIYRFLFVEWNSQPINGLDRLKEIAELPMLKWYNVQYNYCKDDLVMILSLFAINSLQVNVQINKSLFKSHSLQDEFLWKLMLMTELVIFS